MEDKLSERINTNTMTMAVMEDQIGELKERLAAVEGLAERLALAEKALATLSNTLHVIDATSLLALYSLIKTDNLRQPTFESNQDIIDSGCSDAINRMMKTVLKVNANEKKNGEDKS